jgi:N-acetylneuraminic acid mutarotase
MPGAREHLMSCTDTNGDFWLFGGGGYDATQGGELNDLWKFDGANWTWVSGADTVWQAGIYGTKGIGAASNVPGARYDSELWCDKNGNLWLFGGGHEVGGVDCYNDLWKFDGANWTWVSGSDTTNQTGVYGTKGIASPANVPGSRLRATSWSDSYGNLWLFGGEYYVGNTSFVYFNDLWKYDGTNWTWVSGSDTTNQKGVYGTKGIPSATNVPGARSDAIAWIDQNDNLWLFGGGGYDSEGNGGGLNDLWKFDGTNWTWVSGADIGVWQGGIYGTKGIASASNIPGSRRSAPGSVDNSGNFWLFGGYGIDSAGNGGYLNDIWKFDGTNWTWIGGPDIVDQPGVYGIQGAASASNVPGARARFASWTDKSGNFWLFGGRTGYYSDAFNDLWFFQVE